MLVRAYAGNSAVEKFDRVVCEEPLELRATGDFGARTLAVTMRTPGHDFELAAGFAFAEGVFDSQDDLEGLSYCVDRSVAEKQRFNIVNIALRAAIAPVLERHERHFVTNSSCGVCGRASIESLEERGITPLSDGTRVSIETVYALPDRMREAQRVFSSTGGLHAAGIFEGDGSLIVAREDVGRHNAVDKIIGWAIMQRRSPLTGTILCLSGRTSYEIVQKAAVARIPILCAVSAPSSLAIDMAQRFNITLLGFVRDGRANVYSAPDRIFSRSGADSAIAGT
ncbi:MAG: formate dehydrogenase accessory sulfurtransferase FdhD [Candidatus Eremiobacteraeota bacterium]|nr:formate dehydrogenase accessory sulfurtransferase FdhD [Candidatus Eremiobacteraeota bacterium]